MKQSQPLRVENPKVGWLGTTKTLHARLWFINNAKLEERVLGYLAKYQEKYEVELFGFALQGNHYHLVAKFSKLNQSAFYRDFNARIAEALRYVVKDFPGGPFVQRRYSAQALPSELDIENKVYYCALQAVNSGLTEKISEYPGYNSFKDAVHGINRKYKVVDWARYNAAKRDNSKAKISDYTKEYTLKYSRIPGTEGLSPKEYIKKMYAEVEKLRLEKVAELKKEGHTFLTRKELLAQKPGSAPKTTKKSSRNSYRPLVICCDPVAMNNYLEEYFSIYHEYKVACRRYLNGEHGVIFPPGTYRPPSLCCC